MVAKRADVIDQRRQLLGERPVELGEGLFDAADGEDGVDAVKPCLGCVHVVVWNADCTGEIVFAAALYKPGKNLIVSPCNL
jgi:hypothetical protein